MSLKVGPLRDLALLLGGLVVLANETFITKEPREVLLILVAAMLGLPAFIRTDKLFQSQAPKPGSEPEEKVES